MRWSVRNGAAATAVVALSCVVAFTARSSPILTYDNPVVVLTPGESVNIGVTLTDPGLMTDGLGEVLPLFPQSSPVTISVYQQEEINPFLFGTPAFVLAHNSVFSVASPNPVASLDISNSVDLILGTLTADSTLPPGTYPTDIGINGTCIANICTFSPFSGPSFADAGLLTVEVVDVPEPATLALFSVALAGFSLVRRRKRKGA